MDACIASLTSLVNVCVLLSLGLFVFATLGMAIFDEERAYLFKDESNLYGHLDTVFGSLQLMFVAATGDAWAGLLETLVTTVPDKKVPAVIYFVLLALFITLLMLNPFVVVVTESYEVLADKVRRDELV